MGEDRPQIEALADEWSRANSLTWVSRAEERRTLAADLRAAIQADRAAGWFNTPEDYVFLQDLLAERDRLGAEVERLRSNVTSEGETAAFIERVTDERDRAEATLDLVRMLSVALDEKRMEGGPGEAIRAVLDRDQEGQG